MENESIFNKINQENNENTRSKEEIADVARGDIASIEVEKENIFSQKKNLDERISEFSQNRAEFREMIDKLSSIFQDEKQKAQLAEKGITNINGLLLQYSDTNEVREFFEKESKIKEILGTIKELKKDLSEEHEISNPDYSERARHLSAFLEDKIKSKEKEQLQLSANTPEGREEWPVYLEDELKEEYTEKLPAIREVYHQIADYIDNTEREAVDEFNRTKDAGKEEIKFTDPGRKDLVLSERFSIEIPEKDKIEFYFVGLGYTKKQINLVKQEERWFAKDVHGSIQALADNDFLKIWNSKLDGIKDYAQSLANEKIG